MVKLFNKVPPCLIIKAHPIFHLEPNDVDIEQASEDL